MLKNLRIMEVENEQRKVNAMAPGLKELNTRFAAIGLPVTLSPENAASLKNQAPRERVLNALSRVESANDSGAMAYLRKIMDAAGLLAPNGAPNGPSNGHRSAAPAMSRPAQSNDRSAPPPEARWADTHPNAPGNDAAQSRPSGYASPAGTAAPRTRGPSHHIYGKKAAAMFELDETKSGVATVALDAAQTIGERQYDWKNKIRLQMTASEVPVVAAVLFGVLGECNFANHGPDSDKGFSIEWQGDRRSFFVKVWQGKGNLRAVPMTRDDAFHVGQIVLRALQQASPARLDATGALACVRAFYGRS